MKLAEALIQRADCQKRIQQLRERLTRSTQVQDEVAPPEDPQALIAELDATVNELVELIKKINSTSSGTTLEDRMTRSDSLAQRDPLLLKRSIYDSIVNAAAVKKNRYGRSEIKTLLQKANGYNVKSWSGIRQKNTSSKLDDRTN